MFDTVHCKMRTWRQVICPGAIWSTGCYANRNQAHSVHVLQHLQQQEDATAAITPSIKQLQKRANTGSNRFDTHESTFTHRHAHKKKR